MEQDRPGDAGLLPTCDDLAEIHARDNRPQCGKIDQILEGNAGNGSENTGLGFAVHFPQHHVEIKTRVGKETGNIVSKEIIQKKNHHKRGHYGTAQPENHPENQQDLAKGHDHVPGLRHDGKRYAAEFMLRLDPDKTEQISQKCNQKDMGGPLNLGQIQKGDT